MGARAGEKAVHADPGEDHEQRGGDGDHDQSPAGKGICRTHAEQVRLPDQPVWTLLGV